MKNTRGIPENAEKGLQATPADSWPLHGAVRLPVKQRFLVVVAKNPQPFVSLH